MELTVPNRAGLDDPVRNHADLRHRADEIRPAVEVGEHLAPLHWVWPSRVPLAVVRLTAPKAWADGIRGR